MSWHDEAACRDMPDPDLFYPAGPDDPGIAAAKAVCARCDVPVECLTDAIAARDVDSIRAGMTGDERREMRLHDLSAALNRTAPEPQAEATA